MNANTLVLARRPDGAVVPALVHSASGSGFLCRQFVVAESAAFYAGQSNVLPLADVFAELEAAKEAVFRLESELAAARLAAVPATPDEAAPPVADQPPVVDGPASEEPSPAL